MAGKEQPRHIFKPLSDYTELVEMNTYILMAYISKDLKSLLTLLDGEYQTKSDRSTIREKGGASSCGQKTDFICYVWHKITIHSYCCHKRADYMP